LLEERDCHHASPKHDQARFEKHERERKQHHQSRREGQGRFAHERSHACYPDHAGTADRRGALVKEEYPDETGEQEQSDEIPGLRQERKDEQDTDGETKTRA